MQMALGGAGQHDSRWSANLSTSAKIGCAPQTLNEIAIFNDRSLVVSKKERREAPQAGG